MRNLIYIFILSTLYFASSAQNVGVSGSFMPSPGTVGEESVLSIGFQNICFCTISPGNTYIGVDFPPAGPYSIPPAPTGAGAAFFTWVLNGSSWVGTSNQTIPLLSNLQINFTVIGLSIGGPATTVLTVGLNSGSDPDPLNDFATPSLAVQAPMPIELTSFSAKSNECGKVDLAWSTASEVNNDYMEVQRSTDGMSYIAVGVVKGANNPRGADYTYTDDHALIDGVRYYYRLKQVDFDGRSETHKVVSVMLKCPLSELGMKIYPNPAIYNTSLTITGANNPGVSQVKMTNASGEVVRTFSVETDVVKEIDLTGLPAGIYQLQSSDLAAPLVKRFIKID